MGRLLTLPIDPESSGDACWLCPFGQSQVGRLLALPIDPEPTAVRFQSRLAFPRVVLLGDSLTQLGWSDSAGWVARLADALSRRCDVQNRGFSGYNSRWCSRLAPALFPPGSLADAPAFLIFLGANDSHKAGHTTHLDPADYETELVGIARYLVDTAGLRPAALVLCSPPPVDEAAWGRFCREQLNTEGTKSLADCPIYRDACRRAAEAAGAGFCDVYDGFVVQPDWHALLSDGLHLSRAGADRLFQLVWPEIDARTRHLPVLGPEWRMVDPANLGAAFGDCPR